MSVKKHLPSETHWKFLTKSHVLMKKPKVYKDVEKIASSKNHTWICHWIFYVSSDRSCSIEPFLYTLSNMNWFTRLKLRIKPPDSTRSHIRQFPLLNKGVSVLWWRQRHWSIVITPASVKAPTWVLNQLPTISWHLVTKSVKSTFQCLSFPRSTIRDFSDHRNTYFSGPDHHHQAFQIAKPFLTTLHYIIKAVVVQYVYLCSQKVRVLGSWHTQILFGWS